MSHRAFVQSKAPFLVAALSLLVSPSAPAQVLELADERVEFLGLRHWTVEQVQAELERTQSGASLHQCAAALKDLGFADAAVMNYLEEGRRYTVVTVVEPEDAGRVRFREPLAGDSAPVARWAEAAQLRGRNGVEYSAAVSRWLAVRKQGEAARAQLSGQGLDAEALAATWTFLRDHATQIDFHLAIWTLAYDPNADNRATAVALLLNFVDSDLAMWSLMEAVRDPAPAVRDACLPVLWAVAHHADRRVDWTPACAGLRAVLGGTNLFALHHVLQVLTITEVDPALAGELLSDNAHLVLAYLNASHHRERVLARAFLSQLRGRDLGALSDSWNAWLSGLERR